MWRTYVVIYLTITPLSTTLCTLCGFVIPCSSLIWCQIILSMLLSFPYFCRVQPPACLRLTFVKKKKKRPSIPGHCDFLIETRVSVCLSSCSQAWKPKEPFSYLGCGQCVCWLVSCFGEHFDIKRVQLTSVMMNWLKRRRLSCVVTRHIVLSIITF